MTFDDQILTAISKIRLPWLNQAMTDITALGSFSVLLILSFITIVFLLHFRDRLGIWQLVTVMTGAMCIPRTLKYLISRPRPEIVESLALTNNSSFPSGHTFAAASMYLTLAFLVSRYRHALRYDGLFLFGAIAIVLLVGLSRMYLGVHYATDVIGGLVLGAAWAGVNSFFFHKRSINAGRGTK